MTLDKMYMQMIQSNNEGGQEAARALAAVMTQEPIHQAARELAEVMPPKRVRPKIDHDTLPEETLLEESPQRLKRAPSRILDLLEKDELVTARGKVTQNVESKEPDTPL